jgi:uncharacterized protein (TIGR02646 family)
VIRINKPQRIPDVLSTRGKRKCLAHISSYEQDKAKFESGEKKFRFDSSIYGHQAVKRVLIKAQHEKCCFCESKVTHISYGDVEHFRPKGGYRQSKGSSLRMPGYYWLAYEWSNLFFCCQLCNQRYKENLFPLKAPNKRAKSHYDDLGEEQPIFINPEEDAEKYISFREEVVFAVGNNKRGDATIKALRLDRDELNDMRRDVYEKLKLIYKVAYLNPPIPESAEARNHVRRAVQDSGQYASMVRTAVEARFKAIPD